MSEEQVTGETPELVSVPQATDADLLSFLQNAPDTEEIESPEPEQIEEEELEDSEEEEVSSGEKPVEDPAKPPTEAELQAQLQAKEAELQKARDALKQQELYIQRRGNEIGQLRRENTDYKAQLEAALAEKRFDDPVEARKIEKELDKVEGKLQGLDVEEVEMRRRYDAQEIVLQHINPGDVDVDEMGELLLEDGLPPAYVERFKADPFGVDGVFLVNLAKRTQERREKVQAKDLLKRVVDYAKGLEKENSSLKGKPEKLLRDVQNAAKRMPTLNAKTGGASTAALKGQSLSQRDLSQLPDEELNALLK